MDRVKMESVPTKEEVPELVPIRLEFSGLASLPIKQEPCEILPCDTIRTEVLSAGIKAECNELEISQTKELFPIKVEVLEIEDFKQAPLKVESECLEPGREECEDLKAAPPELGPVCRWECRGGVLERICVREQGAGEEGFHNSKDGGGEEDEGSWYSECSPAGE
ncbi:hypothetical protein EOD39_17996 [Acipenser ruthenus]|uniref:Uncharacterized protein n=1 Tax=Acipenser ruthenus TaxID=7906 RepID=A0A444V1U7_ACIRT|nr:hypothetical protein EOD39_17996 [Acipenser ruthenus]